MKEARQELADHPQLGPVERAIYAFVRKIEFPSQIDLDGGCASLARIQYVYRQDPLDMANGNNSRLIRIFGTI